MLGEKVGALGQFSVNKILKLLIAVLICVGIGTEKKSVLIFFEKSLPIFNILIEIILHFRSRSEVKIHIWIFFQYSFGFLGKIRKEEEMCKYYLKVRMTFNNTERLIIKLLF